MKIEKSTTKSLAQLEDEFLGNIIFFSEEFLHRLDCQIDSYDILVGRNICATICVVVKGHDVIYKDPVIYGGLIFAKSVESMGIGRIVNFKHRAITVFAEFLEENYRNVQIQLDTSISDIRGFLWHRWMSVSRIYKADIRYTSHINLSVWEPSHMDEQRRRLYRKGKKIGQISSSFDWVNFLIDCMDENLTKQGARDDFPSNEILVDLCSSLLLVFLKRIAQKLFSTCPYLQF